LAVAIGVIAGLRALTAAAVVAWAARLGWLNLQGSSVAWISSAWAVFGFTVAALGELVTDQLPKTPPRTKPVPLIARIVTGGLSGACICAAGGRPLWQGAILGGIGAVAGAFAGYRARTGLVRMLRVPDAAIAVPEDLVAIGIGLLLVSRL
jgi:uncharacterized membrane protein